MAMGSMTRRSLFGTLGVGALSLAACGGGSSEGGDAGDETIRIEMITDTGGVNDQSFNQLAWAGLERMRDEKGYEVSYMESKQDSDYMTNLDKAVDDECAVIWGIGYAMTEAINMAAEQNPDMTFGSIEGTETNNDNLTCVLFKSQEPSFVAGYIAASMSEKGKVGFIGGMESETIQAFEYGYYAGVEYANKQNGTSVTYQGQYAESFGDAAKGKSIAQKMIKDGCDVMFHAAGGTGVGMLEACNDAGVWCIGVDQDQAALFPDYTTIITSVLKRVDNAIVSVTEDLIAGKGVGEMLVLGAEQDAVGLADTHDLIPDGVYEPAIALFDSIKAGEIEVPDTKDKLDAFVKTL